MSCKLSPISYKYININSNIYQQTALSLVFTNDNVELYNCRTYSIVQQLRQTPKFVRLFIVPFLLAMATPVQNIYNGYHTNAVCSCAIYKIHRNTCRRHPRKLLAGWSGSCEPCVGVVVVIWYGTAPTYSLDTEIIVKSPTTVPDWLTALSTCTVTFNTSQCLTQNISQSER